MPFIGTCQRSKIKIDIFILLLNSTTSTFYPKNTNSLFKYDRTFYQEISFNFQQSPLKIVEWTLLLLIRDAVCIIKRDK